MVGGLARVSNNVEEIQLLAGSEPLSEGLLDQRAQAAGGILDHVNQLFKLSVNVTNHMDGALGQGESSAEIRDRRESCIGVRILHTQRPQIGECSLIQRRLLERGLVTHNK